MVECGYGDIEALSHRSWTEHYSRMVSMSAPACLLHVTLSHVCGHAGRWPKTHDVYHHHRHLCYACITKVFLHQREAGAARRGHGLATGQTCADTRSQRCDFILHLDENVTENGQFDAHQFHDLTGRRYGYPVRSCSLLPEPLEL